MQSGKQPTFVIVNADDYCYFDCVSRGILDAARKGIVKATGIFANTAWFDRHVDWLQDSVDLDLGVHLNLTHAEPLTRTMQKRLSRWNGRFPGKFALSMAVVSGSVKVADVRAEWQAQIERCLEKNLFIRFLNSHEHIHMLPTLFPVLQELAKEYDIKHIRFPTAEPSINPGTAALVRNTAMKLLEKYNRRNLDMPVASFFGMGPSGALNTAYFKEKLPVLKPGNVYELMCHPGYYDPDEIRNPKLSGYHDWEGELQALTSSTLKELCARHNIRPVGYRDLVLQAGRFTVSPSMAEARAQQ